MNQITVRPITAEQTHSLRLAVLRPGQPPETAIFPCDAAPHTHHLGAFLGQTLVGIATLTQDPLPGDPAPTDWRLRGMAIAPTHQRQGFGRTLLTACLASIHSHGGHRLWCNARSTARAFYESQGFATRGEEFTIPGIGPHFVMSCTLGKD